MYAHFYVKEYQGMQPLTDTGAQRSLRSMWFQQTGKVLWRFKTTAGSWQWKMLERCQYNERYSREGEEQWRMDVMYLSNSEQSKRTASRRKDWVETTLVSISWWMNKQNVIYPYGGILPSNKKKKSTDTCYNKEKLWGKRQKRPHTV